MIAEPASADPRIDLGKVTLRREAKVAAIVESAWELAREHGIAGVSLHALAREVGMRQPSLYAYFDSKHALYDAMFADGNRRLRSTARPGQASSISACCSKEVLGRVRGVCTRGPGSVPAALRASRAGFYAFTMGPTSSLRRYWYVLQSDQ